MTGGKGPKGPFPFGDSMNYNNFIGSCPRCGAPITQFTGLWNATVPPPVQYTCSCFASISTNKISFTTETTMNLTTLRKELTDNKFDDASFVSGVETALDYVFLLMEREQLSNAAKVIDDIEVDDILDFFLHDVYPHIEK